MDGLRRLGQDVVVPGTLIGSGRTADIFDAGPGRVLRRYRGDRDATREAELMRQLGAAGYPVPCVYDASGPDIIMERLDGRDMVADLGVHPWRARRYGHLLAVLHNRLHELPAPPGLAVLGLPGDQILHMDLHPANVMLTARGPVVIDWTSAYRGPAGADVAMAYLIVASSDTDLIPPMVRWVVPPLRAVLLRQFLAAASSDPWPHMAKVAEHRIADPNVRPAEADRLRRLRDAALRRHVDP
jgi:aminoglycoside phosphotransferase (APT) family kinase protein